MSKLLEDLFPTEAAAIDAAADRHAARVAAERATLTRTDGAAVYGAQEAQERLAAILEAAGVEYDAATARHLTIADTALATAEAELARLDGADGWERLTDAERQAAATRQPFIAEDAATLPADTVATRARVALAAKDKPAAYLWLRGLERRPRTGSADAQLGTVIGELRALLGLDGQAEKRRGLERKIEGTKSLRGRVDMARRRVDGRDERMEAGLRRQYASLV